MYNFALNTASDNEAIQFKLRHVQCGHALGSCSPKLIVDRVSLKVFYCVLQSLCFSMNMVALSRLAAVGAEVHEGQGRV